MITRRIRVINALGLHARAAARFVGIASRFASEIRVTSGERTVDGKSILGLLLLAAACGRDVIVSVEGPDEALALEALEGLVLRGFEEA